MASEQASGSTVTLTDFVVVHWRRVSALILVPVVLAIADIASTRTGLKYLLLPPFAALTYALFVNPSRVTMNARRIIVCPTATAFLAWIVASALGYNTLSVLVVTVGTMLIMWTLDATMMVPSLALALLTLLLHDQVRGNVGYVVSVLIFSSAVYLLYLLWLRLPSGRLHDENGDLQGRVAGYSARESEVKEPPTTMV